MATQSAAVKPAQPRTKAHKRAPGRPGRKGHDLREHLLDAAIACYVRHGIAGTSLRAIATEAAVTPALLHYYFGDKAQLVHAVTEERVVPAFDGVRLRLRADADVPALVASVVNAIGDTVQRHPWLPPLWLREVLCEGGALRSLMLERLAPQMPLMMAQRFAQAKAAGQLNPDLDPRLLVVSLIGLTLFPAAGAPIWRRMFAADDLGPDALRDHTIALLDRGIGVG